MSGLRPFEATILRAHWRSRRCGFHDIPWYARPDPGRGKQVASMLEFAKSDIHRRVRHLDLHLTEAQVTVLVGSQACW